jgi:membrane protease YdiL (CAAX protease family)
MSSLLAVPAMDWKLALRNLAIIWVFAGFGEEVAYIAATLYVAVLFGFGHFYKGPAGITDSTYSGLVLGGVYLLSGRNLWASILAHGISDTLAIVTVFMGWAT